MTARPLLAMLEKPVLIQLWRINVGTGFNAPTMTFEVNGKQYVEAAARLHAGAARAAQPRAA